MVLCWGGGETRPQAESGRSWHAKRAWDFPQYIDYNVLNSNRILGIRISGPGSVLSVAYFSYENSVILLYGLCFMFLSS